jgi:RHS repeat-associated protein
VEIPSADRTVSTGTNYFGASANLTQMFTGQETDGGTATLDYFNARHFSAVLGSMTQPDPINAGGDIMNPQSWNAYAYVLGNPLGLVDPSGMDPQCGPGRYFTGEGCSGPPSGLTDGQNNYVNVVVIPGFMSGVNSKYPAPVSTPFPSGLTSATIFFGNDTARQVALSAQSVPGADDPPVGLDIWKGQQNLWSNTAGFGNSLTLGTAAVVAAPFALQSAG